MYQFERTTGFWISTNTVFGISLDFEDVPVQALVLKIYLVFNLKFEFLKETYALKVFGNCNENDCRGLRIIPYPEWVANLTELCKCMPMNADVCKYENDINECTCMQNERFVYPACIQDICR